MPQPITSYDEIAYPSQPFPQTHPDRLATIGKLLGMAPASPDRCGYLELGCGDGFNLLPMALTMPNSRFVGIDLSSKAIERGRAFQEQLGLRNVELHCADVMTWPLPEVPFDYIMAHGLFSWVPPPVQQRVLAICRSSLAPQGIAYISYNTHPGGHIRTMLREMMRFHASAAPTPVHKLHQAKALIQFLLAGQTQENEYTALLRKESEWILDRSNDAVLYHDDLADVNHFFYFRDFAALVGQHGLQYLSEADFYETQDRIYPPAIIEALKQLAGNVVLKEQYLDFLKCRRFRQTLLCHSDVKLERDIPLSRLAGFRVSSVVKPQGPLDLVAGQIMAFAGPRGAALKIDHPLTKAALVELATRAPMHLSFEELLLAASRRLETAAAEADDVEVLQQVLLAGYSAGMMEFHLLPPAWIETISERPRISPIALAQLRRGDPIVTTLRHHALAVEEQIDRGLLSCCDGEHDRKSLIAKATQLLATTGPAGAKPEEMTQGVLSRAGRSALLLA
jgi:SAM-dependent methyltransferase